MNMADRIQDLRKNKGISQEELADKIGVSRQAVSKWESKQSTPDLEKIIMLSEFFNVTTDYIIKGIEPIQDNNQKRNKFISKALYIASTAFIAIGLFCAFGSWYQKQGMAAVWGSMIIQVVGVCVYFMGRSLSDEKALFYIDWLNIIGLVFMPISMATGYLLTVIFKQGWVAPYPSGILHTFVFGVTFLIIAAISFIILKRRGKRA